MIKSRYDQYEAICEGPGCGVIEEGEASNFKEFVEHIKSKGWIITKDSNGWHHYCSEQCKEMPF